MLFGGAPAKLNDNSYDDDEGSTTRQQDNEQEHDQRRIN